VRRFVAVVALLAAVTAIYGPPAPARADTDTHGTLSFHPFTMDGCTTATPGSHGRGNCDPVNLVFPDATWQEVRDALIAQGWTTSGFGDTQYVHVGASAVVAQNVQLFRSSGSFVRYHMRIWSAPGGMAIAGVHHESGIFQHTIDMDWDAAEAFVASQLCGPGRCHGIPLALQSSLQGGDGEWRGWANDASATAIYFDGPAFRLVFTTQPGGATVGRPLNPQPQVAVRDGLGATATADNATIVTLSLGGSPGTAGCAGGLSRTVLAGMAAFNGCSVDSPGTFSFQATASGTISPATSAQFVVQAPAPGIGRHQLAATALGSEVLVAGRNEIGELWFRETLAGSWGPWMRVGGGVAGRPVAVTIAGEPFVFFRGAAGDFAYYHRSGGVWTLVSLGGVMVGDPAAAIDGDGDAVVAHLNAAGDIWTRRLSGGSWAPWAQITGTLAHSLILVRHGDDIRLMGINASSNLWTIPWLSASDSWGAWEPLGGVLEPGLAAGATPGGDFAVAGVDVAGKVWTRTLTAGNWGPWTLDPGILAGPAAIASTPGVLMLAGVSANGAAWAQPYTGGWQGWTALGGVLGTEVLLAASGSAVHLFALNADGELWTRRWDGASWGGWSSLGGILAIE
jgi:hypothetical protein